MAFNQALYLGMAASVKSLQQGLASCMMPETEQSLSSRTESTKVLHSRTSPVGCILVWMFGSKTER